MQKKAAKPAVSQQVTDLPALRPTESFQDLILSLQQFWGEQGCVVLQPYDMEVGAGTFHPATTLRALGPRPWNAAYVQPSRRPKDGRYGENPNRLQHYYQFQVIMKPSPADFQDLYLESLARIGIDPMKALVFTAVFNGVAAVPLIFIIAKIAMDKNIMGVHRSGLLSNIFVWGTFAIMALAALAMFFTLGH